jgi:hypothetical protein
MGDEVGYSLAQNPAGAPQGFIISGYTTTNAGAGDPQDLYLVSTNLAGGVNSGCGVPWNPNVFMPNWQGNALAPVILMPAQNVAVATPPPMTWTTGFLPCP